MISSGEQEVVLCESLKFFKIKKGMRIGNERILFKVNLPVRYQVVVGGFC